MIVLTALVTTFGYDLQMFDKLMATKTFNLVFSQCYSNQNLGLLVAVKQSIAEIFALGQILVLVVFT
jgi:hypothetical protein